MQNRRNFLKRAGSLLAACGSLETLAACMGSATATPSGGIDHLGLKVPRLLQWGATSTDDAPYIFQDPTHPGCLMGFEIDLAAALAKAMGIKQQQVEIAYAQLASALEAVQCDVILNRWDITQEHKRTALFSQPYYRYGQQIVVRTSDARFIAYTQIDPLSLTNLEGFTVGARASTKAAALLASHPGITLATYDPDVPLNDLAQGHVDAVLIDQPTAVYYVEGAGLGIAANPALRLIGKPFETSDYAIAISRANVHAAALQHELDQALARLKRDGSLRQIAIRWKLWNEQQIDLGMEAGASGQPGPERTAFLGGEHV